MFGVLYFHERQAAQGFVLHSLNPLRHRVLDCFSRCGCLSLGVVEVEWILVRIRVSDRRTFCFGRDCGCWLIILYLGPLLVEQLPKQIRFPAFVLVHVLRLGYIFVLDAFIGTDAVFRPASLIFRVCVAAARAELLLVQVQVIIVTIIIQLALHELVPCVKQVIHLLTLFSFEHPSLIWRLSHDSFVLLDLLCICRVRM